MFTSMFENKKMINGKPVRKRIAFVTLPFFESLYIIVLSASFFFKIYCLLV